MDHKKLTKHFGYGIWNQFHACYFHINFHWTEHWTRSSVILYSKYELWGVVPVYSFPALTVRKFFQTEFQWPFKLQCETNISKNGLLYSLGNSMRTISNTQNSSITIINDNILYIIRVQMHLFYQIQIIIYYDVKIGFYLFHDFQNAFYDSNFTFFVVIPFE